MSKTPAGEPSKAKREAKHGSSRGAPRREGSGNVPSWPSSTISSAIANEQRASSAFLQPLASGSLSRLVELLEVHRAETLRGAAQPCAVFPCSAVPQF
eukprot:scaffold2326_cov286-Pinguiococcus_pyrenoidosus.AAC.14